MGRASDYRHEVFRHASAFRRAIETVDRRRGLFAPFPLGSGVFRHFPRGCCWGASRVLGLFLSDHGLGGFDHVQGTRGSCRGDATWSPGDDGYRYCSDPDSTYEEQAWLEQGRLIVDITADQDGQSPVIVTEDSPWHRTWARARAVPVLASFRDVPMRLQELLWTAYLQLGPPAEALLGLSRCNRATRTRCEPLAPGIQGGDRRAGS
jgi:hypothetical protein